MKWKKLRTRRLLSRWLLCSGLGLSSFAGWLHAQEPTALPAPAPRGLESVQCPQSIAPVDGSAVCPPCGTVLETCPDPCAPCWCDPICRVPNMFGDFFGGSLRASRTTFSTQSLHYTGAGAEGGFFATIATPVTVTGPGGPHVLTGTIPINNLMFSGGFPTTFTLGENNQLTSLVHAGFPGASFVDGGGSFDNMNLFDLTFFYDYLFNSSQKTTVNLPNPSGGGLVGRNNYFEDGTPLPQDRVYFFYDHVGSFQGLGQTFDINRYVFGVEKTFLDGYCSIELRVPFAGTANSDQVAGEELSVDHTEFGNVGLLVKGAVYRTPNFVATVGLGFSLPTASDSRLYVGSTPVVAIENRACLLQPLAGVAWAPNDCFYAQAGVQIDCDPSGNPVEALNASGGLSRIGVLNDQTYGLFNAAVGRWVYQDEGSGLRGVALQGELHWIHGFGPQDTVQADNVTVGDFSSKLDILTATPGIILRIGKSTDVSVGVTLPLTSDRFYNWSIAAQVNVRF